MSRASRLDFTAFLLPGRRLDPDAFQAGLAFVALMDGVRLLLFSGTAAAMLWLGVLFCLGAVYANRLRDSGGAISAAAAPLLAAVAVKVIVAIAAASAAMYPEMLTVLAERGVDVNDPEAVNQALSDPQVRQAVQHRFLEDPEAARDVSRAGAWPSTYAFWAAVAVSALWYVRRPSRP